MRKCIFLIIFPIYLLQDFPHILQYHHAVVLFEAGRTGVPSGQCSHHAAHSRHPAGCRQIRWAPGAWWGQSVTVCTYMLDIYIYCITLQCMSSALSLGLSWAVLLLLRGIVKTWFNQTGEKDNRSALPSGWWVGREKLWFSHCPQKIAHFLSPPEQHHPWKVNWGFCTDLETSDLTAPSARCRGSAVTIRIRAVLGRGGSTVCSLQWSCTA